MIVSKPSHSIHSNTNQKKSQDTALSHHRPLPSVLTDLIAIKLCDLIPTRPLPTGCSRTAPELLYFILKVTSRARISCHIAVVALIYLDKCKKALPKNAIGDQDTIHRIFIASILVASKYLHGTCWGITADDHVWLNNARMADICSDLFTLEQVNQLELSFLKLIHFECFVNANQVQDYLVQNRQDLCL
ncbi:hypothetical protein K501DRAFT_224591 [Backusella circina FSU 941]|nr:hypothetical protein K501DRAFT_224591 [Backusella circina FSU 941]